MCASPVFGTAQVTISQSFLQAMPVSLDKSQFFQECCEDLHCIVSEEGECPSYTLGGLWKTVVNAHDVLNAHLLLWNSQKEESINSVGVIPDVSCIGADTENNSNQEDGSAIELIYFGEECIIESSKTALDLGEGHSVTNIDIIRADKNDDKTRKVIETMQDLNEDLKGNLILRDCESKIIGKVLSKNPRKQTICPSEKRKVPKKLQTSHPIEEILGDAKPRESVKDDEHFDIHIEHNYNHLKQTDNDEASQQNDDIFFENEIYMDIKLAKSVDNTFGVSTQPVTLVMSKENKPGVEFLQLNISNEDNSVSSQKETAAKQLSLIARNEITKLRRKRYEEKTPFKYFCSQCSFKTKRHSHMRKHSRFHEKVCTIYSCDQCDFSTIRASHFQRHLGSHQTELFACSECTYSTHVEQLLIKHQRTKHVLKKPDKSQNKTNYHCVFCNYTTTRETFIKRHMMKHAKRKAQKEEPREGYKCENCSYKTLSRSNYQRHVSSVHADERPYMCTTCGVQFKRSDVLVQHQITHINQGSEASEFQCQTCHKHFRSASVLQQHLLTHEEVKRYLCEVCGAAFKTRACHRKHLKTHFSAKLHVCHICTKKFSSKFVLKRHMKVHLTFNSQPETIQEQNEKETSSSQLGDLLVSVPCVADDVQVLVPQSELSVQPGSILQVTPVEYIIHNFEGCDIGNTVSVSGAPISTSEEGIITLSFVPEDSSLNSS